MDRMLAALLIGATMATPALAQDRGSDDDRHGRIDRPHDGGWPDHDSADRDRFDGPQDRAPHRHGSDRDDRFGNRRGNDRGRWQDDRFANNQGDHRWTGHAGSWNRDWRGDSRYDWQDYRRGNDHAFRAPRYYGPRGVDYGYRRWSPGYRVAPAYYGQGYWITRPDHYHLPPAYGGYRWVRYYDDVALVDIRSGLIADILYSFFL